MNEIHKMKIICEWLLTERLSPPQSVCVVCRTQHFTNTLLCSPWNLPWRGKFTLKNIKLLVCAFPGPQAPGSAGPTHRDYLTHNGKISRPPTACRPQWWTYVCLNSATDIILGHLQLLPSVNHICGQYEHYVTW